MTVKKIDDLQQPKMIARDEVYRDLKGYYEKAYNGDPMFVLINGEEGMGKTRIVEELRQELVKKHKKDEIGIMEEVCHQDDERKPFWRIVHALYLFYKEFGILSRENYRGKPPGTMSYDFVEFTMDNYNEDNVENIFDAVDSDTNKINNSASCYLRSHAHARPIVWVIEDTHHLDRRSADFLTYLLANIEEGERFLILLLYHGDETSGENGLQRVLPRMRRLPKFREIKLSHLLARDILPFFQSMIGAVELEDEHISGLYKTSRGNPYRIEAFIRELTQKGNVKLKDGAWNIKIDEDLFNELPKDVEEMLLEHVDRLGNRQKDIMEFIAVAGQALDAEFLSSASGLSIGQLPYVLGDLVKDQYLLKEDKDYKIPSRKIASKLLEAMPEKQLKKLHLKMAKLYVKFNRGPHLLPNIASHYLAGEDNKKALSYGIEAGDWLYNNRKYSQANKYFKECFELTKSKKNIVCSILIKLGFTLHNLNQNKEAQMHFQKASTYSPNREEDALIQKGKALCLYGLNKQKQALSSLINIEKKLEKPDGEIYLYLSSIELEKVLLRKAKDSLNKAKELLAGDQANQLQPVLTKNEGTIDFFEGDWKSAENLLDRACTTLRKEKQNKNLAQTLIIYSRLAFYTKGVTAADVIIKEALKFADDLGDWFLQFQSYYLYGLFSLETGNFDESGKYFGQLKDLSKKRGNELLSAYASLGVASQNVLRSKDLKLAEKLATVALNSGNNEKDAALVANAYLVLAKIALREKNVANAQKYFEYSAKTWGSISWEASLVNIQRSRVFAYAKQPKKTIALLAQCENEIKEMGNIYGLADIYYERGWLFRQYNKPAESFKWFTEAEKLYKELNRSVSLNQTLSFLNSSKSE